MNISGLLQKWSGIGKSSKIFILTDDTQKHIAESIKNEGVYDVQIASFAKEDGLFLALKSLKSDDLLVVLLSIDTYVNSGANGFFTPFGKPDWLPAKYIFIRLDISQKSLIQGLSTDKALVYGKIAEMERLDCERTVTVTSESGTDISFRIRPFATCSHEITASGGTAFLPPSETSAEVVPGSANGKIVVDMTVGQLYHFGRLMGGFGLVPQPVVITVENGFIVDIAGGGMGAEFKKQLFSLPVECRKMVELGQGLSKMEPTGLIGVDESILDSCHFGFGDGGSCGTHLDVVIKNPVIQQR